MQSRINRSRAHTAPSSSLRILSATTFVLVGVLASAVAQSAEPQQRTSVAIIESGDAKVASQTFVIKEGFARVSRAEPPRRIASLNLPNGATIEFLEYDGYVDILERTAERMPFVAQELITQWQATPLEVFKALSPGETPPSALVADHSRRDRGAARSLATPKGATLSLNDPGLEPYVCDPLFMADYWKGDWLDAFAGVTSYAEAAYMHHVHAFTFYPGAPVYYGTGTNRETYLGACNGTQGQQVLLFIDRWVVTNVTFNPQPQPPTVTWGWGNVFDTVLENGEKFTFYSGHPHGRFRGRVEGAGGVAVSHQGAAAAWTPSFPIGIGFGS
jgi:hypothetical protein